MVIGKMVNGLGELFLNLRRTSTVALFPEM